MTDLRKAAIELLKSAPDHIQGHWPELDEVCKALAQPEQKPVAWVKEGMVRVGFGRIEERKYVQFDQTLPVGTKLYTAPVSKQEPVREHNKIDLRCECCGYMTYHREHLGCIRAAAPPSKQEPVGVVQRTSIAGYPMTDSTGVEWLTQVNSGDKLYTAPPSKPWVSLTDEEIKVIRQICFVNIDDQAFRVIEAKLKEKNT